MIKIDVRASAPFLYGMAAFPYEDIRASAPFLKRKSMLIDK